MSDPYLSRGLRGNPFVAEDGPGVADDVRIDVGVSEPSEQVVDLVGVRGAGKTTHLLAWCRAAGGRYHHVEPGWRRWRPLPRAARGGYVAWDEVDRVPPLLLRAAVVMARRKGATVRLGTHHATGLADRTLTMPAPTAESVASFARARIAAVELSDAGPSGLALSMETAGEVAAAADGCWWTVGTLLHVWAAEAVAAGSPVTTGGRP